MVPIRFPETSARNCHYSLRNNPEEGRPPLLRGGSKKSHFSTKSLYSYVYDLQQTEVCTPLKPSRRVANFLFVHSRLLLRVMKDITAETIGTFFIIRGKFSECRRLPAVHETRQYKMLCD
jgi:hypothetical protein